MKRDRDIRRYTEKKGRERDRKIERETETAIDNLPQFTLSLDFLLSPRFLVRSNDVFGFLKERYVRNETDKTADQIQTG